MAEDRGTGRARRAPRPTPEPAAPGGRKAAAATKATKATKAAKAAKAARGREEGDSSLPIQHLAAAIEIIQDSWTLVDDPGGAVPFWNASTAAKAAVDQSGAVTSNQRRRPLRRSQVC